MNLAVEIARSLSLLQLGLGIVEITGVQVQPSQAELQQFCDQVRKSVLLQYKTEEWNQQCLAVRQLLRHGKFKASGRSKPAQEYLLKCLLADGRLPTINAPVDLLNGVSLLRNLPISLLSVRKCSSQLLVDRGSAGENYVFNSAGQRLDLTDLITVYDRSVSPFRPVGSPVKDSLAGKIEAEDDHLIAVIYFPQSLTSAAESCRLAMEDLAQGMLRHGQATKVEYAMLPD